MALLMQFFKAKFNQSQLKKKYMVPNNSQLQTHWKVFKRGETMSVGML